MKSSNGRNSLAGRWGEAEAARFLREKGYSLVGANYRCRFGEIDLIASRDGVLAFIEVKLRKSADFAQALEFVDARKRRKLRATAELYLAENPSDLQPRFDVVEIYAPNGAGTRPERIIHTENAF